jgi:peptidoglycan hydrolase CwlO-like protein
MKGTQSPEPQESQPKSGVDIVMPSVNILIASIAVLAMMYMGNGAKMELMTTIDSKLETVNNKIEGVNNKIEAVNNKIEAVQGEFSKLRKKSNKDAVEVKREFFKLKNGLADLEFQRSVSDYMAEE